MQCSLSCGQCNGYMHVSTLHRINIIAYDPEAFEGLEMTVIDKEDDDNDNDLKLLSFQKKKTTMNKKKTNSHTGY